MDHKSCRRQSLNLDILRCQSSITLLLKKSIPNNASTCCSCSRTVAGASHWWQKGWTCRTFSHQDRSGGFRFRLHQKSGSFTRPIKSNQLFHHPNLLAVFFYSGFILCCSLYSVKKDMKIVSETIAALSTFQSNKQMCALVWKSNLFPAYLTQMLPCLCYHFAPVNGKSVAELFVSHRAFIIPECCAYRF